MQGSSPSLLFPPLPALLYSRHKRFSATIPHAASFILPILLPPYPSFSSASLCSLPLPVSRLLFSGFPPSLQPRHNRLKPHTIPHAGPFLPPFPPPHHPPFPSLTRLPSSPRFPPLLFSPQLRAASSPRGGKQDFLTSTNSLFCLLNMMRSHCLNQQCP